MVVCIACHPRCGSKCSPTCLRATSASAASSVACGVVSRRVRLRSSRGARPGLLSHTTCRLAYPWRPGDRVWRPLFLRDYGATAPAAASGGAGAAEGRPLAEESGIGSWREAYAQLSITSKPGQKEEEASHPNQERDERGGHLLLAAHAIHDQGLLQQGRTALFASDERPRYQRRRVGGDPPFLPLVLLTRKRGRNEAEQEAGHHHTSSDTSSRGGKRPSRTVCKTRRPPTREEWGPLGAVICAHYQSIDRELLIEEES